MENIVTRRVKTSLITGLIQAAEKAQEAGVLPQIELPVVSLEVPKEKSHGNFAANLALVLSKAVKMPPRDVARIILDRMDGNPYLEKAEIAGPGFINFYLNKYWLVEVLESILDQDAAFGDNADLAGQKIQLEFVSANPVGPMNVVNARAAALGDTLGNLFTACGAEVEREYYVNDFGVQVWTLGRSLEARYRELLGEPVEFPEDGYRGQYLYDMAQRLIDEKGRKYLDYPEEKRVELLRDLGYQRILETQKTDLGKYGVHYDCWFSERSLHEDGSVVKAFDKLTADGLTYTDDGAVWLRTTNFGDDKDRVLRTADGRTTYFISDIAYHINKFNRGFSRVIDIWGPDHHGYIPRMKAAMQAVGINPANLEILIAQQINLLKDGQPFKMSKRRGEFITMTDLLDEVGNDVARWFFLMRSPDSHLDFDLNLAKSQSNDNPVFYVQYAFSRICSILRQADPQLTEIDRKSRPDALQELAKQWDREEEDLVEKVAHFPDLMSEAARWREPHRITGYLLELATMFHSYYNRRRFIGDDPETSRARIAVAQAVRCVVGKGLRILGISAPERM